MDATKLPPVAPQTIEFGRDIEPLLQNHCLKCHSGEKPKSHFRLTSRDEALKGGEHGIDIIPGQSARSPLVGYVAGLVEDMQMPPEGKGVPLTPQEIGLVRAWIDQGVVWGPVTNPPTITVRASPIAGWTGVSGNEKKFRELYWQHEGWNGGLEEFELTQIPGPDSRVTVAGHALCDDYAFDLSAERDGLGFTHLGWAQFRKYFDDAGGYDPAVSPAPFTLSRDLHLDVGHAYAELGLTLPRWPVLVLGYEYQYRTGTEATLQWGPVSNGAETRNLYPAFKDINERVHVLRLDIDYDLGGFQVTDNVRAEWYHLNTTELDETAYAVGVPGTAFTSANERQKYFQRANTFHVEKQFTDWFFTAGGYLYSKLDADGSVAVDTLNPAFLNLAGNPAIGWQSELIELERESHVFSLSGLLGPWEGLSLYLATQNEWTRQNGLTTANINLALPFAPYIFPVDLENLDANLDHRIFTQDAGLRFTKLPFTTLFAEARLQQEDLGQYQEEVNGLTPFLTRTDARSRLEDFRLGFNTSPWQRLSLSGQFHRSENKTDYDSLLKEALGGTFEGYPDFIRWRDLLSRQAEGKIAYQATAWLKTSVSYQWLDNQYRTATDPADDPPAVVLGGFSPGGRLLAGTYRAHLASLNATLTPWARWFFSGTIAYQNARTITAANGSPAIAPYAGNIYSLQLSGTYSLNDRTTLMAAYSFSAADFAQDNFATGLPLGIDYHQHAVQAGIKRQLSKTTALGLQYRFYRYTEPSSGNVGNFNAQALFATLTCRLP